MAFVFLILGLAFSAGAGIYWHARKYVLSAVLFTVGVLSMTYAIGFTFT